MINEDEIKLNIMDPPTDIATASANEILCYSCKKENSSYTSLPCRCCQYCKKCAMKLATGGKCKICHELFSMKFVGLKNDDSLISNK